MRHLSLRMKIACIFLITLIFSVVFVFFFIHFLYSQLYKKSIEESILYQGKRTSTHYHYGELSDDLIRNIQWYNIVSEYEIIVVDQLDHLTSHFPYQINFEGLINQEDRKALQEGKHIMKEGFVEELDAEIMGAIFPIRTESRLIGYIYIYVPLATIDDVFRDSIPIIISFGLVFFLIIFFILYKVWKSLFTPLQELEKLSIEVARGNYSYQIDTDQRDEIGNLSRAFNQMSSSLKKQEERKKAFISNIVHELRTPLTYIKGYTEALRLKDYKSQEEALHYLQTIEKETERINTFIKDFIDLNSLQEDMYKLNMQPLVIAQTLYDTIELFDIHVKDKKLQFHLEIDESLVVLADEKRMQQVFYNTIDNAVKYSHPGGDIFISLTKDKKQLVYSIKNEGLAIEKEELVKLTSRFYRTNEARKQVTSGTGLGLSIVKEILRLHQGDFKINSLPEGGISMTVKLPLFIEEKGE